MIYICERETFDREDEAEFFVQLDPGFKQKVDVWNRKFTIPYPDSSVS